MQTAEIAANIAESLIIAEFLTRFLEPKRKKFIVIKVIGCFALLFADITLVPMLGFSELVQIAGTLAIAMIYSIVFLKGEIYKKIFVVFISCITILLINITVLTAIKEALGTDMDTLTTDTGAIRLMVLFLTKFLFFLATRLLLKLKSEEKYRFGRSEWLILILIFLMTFFIGITVLEGAVNGKSGEIFMMSAVLGLILTNIITYFLMLKMSGENRERMKSTILAAQVESSEKEIAEINHMYAEIQQIRHDIKHWATGSLALIKQGETKQAEEYIEELLASNVGTLKTYAQTDIPAVNAVINLKLAQAEEKGIEVTTAIGREIGVTDYCELSIVMANLLDNAIEACERIDKPRRIYYEMGIEGNYFKIFIKNTYDGSGIKTKTVKNDKRLHGFGIKSVKKYSEKKGGILNFYEEDGCFCTALWIAADQKTSCCVK